MKENGKIKMKIKKKEDKNEKMDKLKEQKIKSIGYKNAIKLIFNERRRILWK